jgi:GT2 family glycosyltransferase
MDVNLSKVRTGFVCVNFNNSEYTKEFIISCINLVAIGEIKIVIVDNNSEEEDFVYLTNFIRKLSDERIELIRSPNNIGYFRGLNLGLKYLQTYSVDYAVVGNNDLIFDEFFLLCLYGRSFDENFLVIAPDLIKPDGTHQNPHLISPYSRLRIAFKRIYFSNYYLGSFLQILVDTKNRLFKSNVSKNHKEGPIFMGYGACYILTKRFLAKCQLLDANLFLMGEEGAISNQVKLAGGLIYYFPELKVLHNDHSTIGKLPNRFLFEQNKIAFNYLMNECKELHCRS